jgi:thioredoxin 1
MSPILDQLKASKGKTLRILKIDVDKNPAITDQLGIRGVPTLIYYKNGKQLWRKSGVIPLKELETLTK